MSYRDLTYPLQPESAHWPGQPPMTLEHSSEMCCGDVANVSVVRTSMHTGTHMDAPLHFIADADDITHFPLELSMGEVRVAEVLDQAEQLTRADIEAYEARTGVLVAGDRLLFRTRNSREDWHAQPFNEDYCAVSAEAAELLVERGVTFVGVDYLSVAPFADPVSTHRILLSVPVWVVEGLDMRTVSEGRYAYQCLPLLIPGSDASPCRFLLGPALD